MPVDTTSFSQHLISATHNINDPHVTLSTAEITPNAPVVSTITKTRLHGGRQEGVDLVEVNNGAINIRVIPTRGMSILDVTTANLRLGWNSPVDEIVHPAWVNQQNRGRLGWLEAFNEYFVRCGLEWFGPPCEDDHHHAKAEVPAGPVSLHGKIANLPASELQVIVERAKPYNIILRSVVKENQLFGPKFELHTDLVTRPGTNSFQVIDTIRNVGAQTEEFALLYHLNHGSPLLQQGAKLVAPVRHLAPINDQSSSAYIHQYNMYGPPTKGFAEKVFISTLRADRNKKTRVLLKNKARNRGVSIRWNVEKLPCFTIWKNTAAEADGYVTGLEPGTSFPFPRPVERAAKRIPKIKPKQSIQMPLEFTLHTTKADVKAAENAIFKLMKGKYTRLDTQPGGFDPS